MIDVVFHDSAKAGVAEAQRICPEMRRNAAVGLSLYLDVGDISGDLFGDVREAELRRLFSGPEGADAARELMCANRADRDHLLETAARGEPVCIWYSDAPGEMCGLLHAAALLEGLPCPVWAVKLPKLVAGADGWREYTGWSEAEPELFAERTGTRRLLEHATRRALAACWRRLVAEKAPLRAVLNGRVQGVPESFYDFLIDEALPEGEFREALLIGRILGSRQPGVPDGWFARRIARRIESGQLTVTQPAMDGHPYTRMLKRT